ncbi:MAG: HPr family phosphocarrier protein [Lachnospiraceae bacterium]|nr:HPr family phosphocarrier protein [Lachnospiraceae bacterium]
MSEYKIKLTKESVFQFVREAEKCDCDVDLCYDRLVIDAKSILGVLSMDLTRVMTVRFADDADHSKHIAAYAVN